MRDAISRLKSEHNAVILAHNYQRSEVQDIADFVGDSLALARKAMDTDADTIVLCGVDFMAETAKILNPDKRVLMPDQRAVCPMAAALSLDELKSAKQEHPDADVVLYINTLAEEKALCDCVCTSANAPKIVASMESDTVLFGPDSNLAYFASKNTSKKVISVPKDGVCPTHHQISLGDVLFAKKQHPAALVLIHPECVPEIQDIADDIASTEGMVSFARESDATEFLIATENGLLHRLEREVPGKRFYPVTSFSVCPNMKMNTLEKILHVLETGENELVLDKEVLEKARVPIERMLSL